MDIKYYPVNLTIQKNQLRIYVRQKRKFKATNLI